MFGSPARELSVFSGFGGKVDSDFRPINISIDRLVEPL